MKPKNFERNTFALCGLVALALLANVAHAKVLVDLDASTQLSGWDFGTHYGGGIASTNSVTFNGNAAILTGQDYLNTTYSAPAVYVAASRSESTGNFGVGNSDGAGWRIRLGTSVVSGATFFSDNVFAVFNGSFDATNDTLDAGSIYSSDMSAISNGTIRFVLRDTGNWYISEASPNIQTGALDGPLTTNFTIEASSANWYAYDPTVMPSTNGVPHIGSLATPAFTDIDFIGFHLEVVAAAQGDIGAFDSCNFGIRTFSATGNMPATVPADLDATRQWLLENPPGGGNRAVRKLRTDVIDSISTNLSNTLWFDYRDNWSNNAYCDAMTAEHPVLYYLRQAELNAVNDIRNTVVEQGVVIWQMYNMGIIVKTPSRTFAMDLYMRDAEDLVDVLDFAIVSHEHQDHTMPDFLDAMILAGKPVITPSYSGSTMVTNDASFQFGDISVYYKIGSHGGSSTVPMGLCQVDCGASGDDFVIVHTGDGGDYNEFPVSKPVDLFMFHVEVGMPAPAAIDHMQAQVASASHILELGHAVGNYRWLYSYAYNEIADYTQDDAIVLSWGERWVPPARVVPPVVDVSAGASALTASSATLRGELTTWSNASAWVCWGLADTGNSNTGNWDHVVSLGTVTNQAPFSTTASGLSTNTTYFYRCYVTNGVDSAWSEAVAFSGLPEVTGVMWTPSNIVTEAWYDGSDTNTTTLNGGTISLWQDKSGNDHHAIQSTAANQPATGGDINGLNAIEFDPGVGVHYLTNGLQQLTTVSMYIVVNPTARGANAYGCPIGASASGWAANSGLWWTLEQYGTSGERNDVFYTDSLLDKIYGNGVEDFAGHNFQPAILSHQGTGLPTANLDYLIGQRSWGLGTDFAYRGLIGEIIICPADHDVTTRQKIEGYLAHKWGLTAELPPEHPYELTPPLLEATGVNNLAATGISAAAATCNAQLDATGGGYDAYVYYGASNGGTNPAMWDLDDSVGSWTNQQTNVSYTAGGLTTDRTYYYTFAISNASEMLWAAPSWSFRTLYDAAAAVTTNYSIPHAWLASFDPSWSSNYEETVLADQDGDGFSTWEEYWCGTNPTNENSCFKIKKLVLNGSQVHIEWEHDQVGAGIPPIEIHARSNFLDGFWFKAGAHSPSNGLNAWNDPASGNLFYRLVVPSVP